MEEILIDAFNDSFKTVPLLLIIYIGIELLEYKFGDGIRKIVQGTGRAGPLIGAITGAFPQCGFSVIITALFTQRLVTIGTLLAIYLSTSDEAIPIILSQPNGIRLIIPLVGTKILIAILAGYGVDFIFKKERLKVAKHIETIEEGCDNKNHHHEVVLQETACCGHSTSKVSKKFDISEIVWHPIIHTFNVFIFIFLTTLVINLVIFGIGEPTLNNLFSKNTFWQSFLTALIGLIPNCASSVAITELYLKNVIGFGPTIAGLAAGGGLGLLVLYREERNKKIFLKVLAMLYGISVLSGLIIQLFYS
jgi:hypothetical protein